MSPAIPHTPEEYGAIQPEHECFDVGHVELIAKARGLCEHVGRRVATVAETRAALGLCGVPA